VCHAVSYPLTLRYSLRHGHACGLTLGALLEYNAATPPDDCLDVRGADHVRAVTRRIVRALGATTPRAAGDRIDAIRELGGLAPYPAIAADSAAVAAEALTYDRAANNPRLLGSERLHALLTSLEGQEA
jgi:alcohol dehydrogenase class IV